MTGEIFWLLACGSAFQLCHPSSRLHPAFAGLAMGSRIQLQQRNCPRISRGSFAPV